MAIVVSPANSEKPMMPVSVPVVVEKARSSVGRNGPTHRNAVFDTTLADVRTTSSVRYDRGGAAIVTSRSSV